MNRVAEIAFLNGDFLPVAEAKISVNDRGFLFGDGVAVPLESDPILWQG